VINGSVEPSSAQVDQPNKTKQANESIAEPTCFHCEMRAINNVMQMLGNQYTIPGLHRKSAFGA
jgi:tRNA(Arg) A34 adenosine deaminase TadA